MLYVQLGVGNVAKRTVPIPEVDSQVKEVTVKVNVDGIQSAVSVEIRCAERDGATPRYVIDGRPKRAVTIAKFQGWIREKIPYAGRGQAGADSSDDDAIRPTLVSQNKSGNRDIRSGADKASNTPKNTARPGFSHFENPWYWLLILR